MQNVKLKNHLHLHGIVFIWGFTAVLGKLITIDALPLVWYRMGIATLLIGLYLYFKKYTLKVNRKNIILMVLTGAIIALHWVTFFKAIKVSNVSIALATMSTGAFFTALLEPIWYKRKIIGYEILFGLMVILGLYIIFNVETQYVEGIILALLSAFLAAIFSLINAKLIQQEKPAIISFYELGSGALILSIYLAVEGSLTLDLFYISLNDWSYILILASVCTAYAFIVSVKVMKYISPYTVMLTVNMEPVYGIILAFILLGDTEKMNPLFYVGGGVILLTVIANGILKNRRSSKKVD